MDRKTRVEYQRKGILMYMGSHEKHTRKGRADIIPCVARDAPAVHKRIVYACACSARMFVVRVKT